jgi:hypothetical protein
MPSSGREAGPSLAFALPDKAVLEAGAEGMMPVFVFVKRAVKLALECLGQSMSEDLGDSTGGHLPEPQLTTPFEDLVDWEMAFENEIAAVLKLSDGIVAA